MNTPHIHMPPPLNKRTKRLKAWIVLGFGAILCAALVYGLSTLQGVHNSRIIDPQLEIFAGRSGMLDLAVKEGQQVVAGDYLGSVEGGSLRQQLAEMEKRLAPLELALPLEYSGYSGVTGKKDVVNSSDEALRKAENNEKHARERLNAASLEEARAQVVSRKAQQQFQKGTIGKEALVQAQSEALAKKHEAGEALRFFTEVSLNRAAIEKERNRIRFIQEESGLSAVPADVRIREYEALKAEHDALKRVYGNAVFFAPFPGVITAVQAQENTLVEQGQAILSLRPTHGYTVTVTGNVSGLASQGLGVGDRCEVMFPSYGNDALEGVVIGMVPQEGGWRSTLPARMRWVTLYVEVPIVQQGAPLSATSPVSLRLKENHTNDTSEASSRAEGADS